MISEGNRPLAETLNDDQPIKDVPEVDSGSESDDDRVQNEEVDDDKTPGTSNSKFQARAIDRKSISVA